MMRQLDLIDWIVRQAPLSVPADAETAVRVRSHSPLGPHR